MIRNVFRDVVYILVILLIFVSMQAEAYVSKDTAILVSADVSTSPASITLTWPLRSNATTPYQVSRKLLNDTTWTLLSSSVPSDSVIYLDTNIVVGVAYEYKIYQTAGALAPAAYGYLYAGIEVPVVENRGKLLLLVDDSFTVTLSNELARLERDLVGDGWTLLRKDVSRNDSVTNIKAIIQAEYSANPTLKSLFIFGHVPVPYSGNIAPDGHSAHVGAWPADVYYGDMDGEWTDAIVSNTANSLRSQNIPGDGKFDQSYISLSLELELQVGRVDLSGLTYFPESEEELLKRYLAKDYKFRHKMFDVTRRGLVDDGFGYFYGEAFAASGWRSAAAFFGADNVLATDWFSTLDTDPYLFSYGCGGGSYTSANGIGNTADFVANQVHTVFTLLFGSWFGDWDSANNFLRAPLASDPWALTCGWAGRPHWFMHHMGLGLPVGYSTRATQNNTSTEYTYALSSNSSRGGVHVALMGDPSLRLHSVAPPLSLLTMMNTSGEVELNWGVSADIIEGYHVYRASNISGPYLRLNGALVTSVDFTDITPLGGTNYYMVRAQKLETVASGTYLNLSQGTYGTSPSQEVELFVSSPMGSIASPLLGTNTYSLYDSSVIAEMIDSEIITGTTQYIVKGWIGTGDIPGLGSGNETPLIDIKQNSSIEWKWGTNYWLDISSDTNGTVNHVSGWKEAGSNLSIQAIVTRHSYVFSHWSGLGVLSGHENDNPLLLTTDEPKGVMANFGPGPNPYNILPYFESFESYQHGTSLEGTNGWYADRFDDMLITTNQELISSIADYGVTYSYPINTTHDKVAALEDVKVQFTNASNSTIVMKMLVQFVPPSRGAVPSVTGELPQYALSVSHKNEFMIYHANLETDEVVWTTLTNVIVSTEQWHTVTVEMDYQTTGLGYKYFRVGIDGEPWLISKNAYSNNDGTGTNGGFWFANTHISAYGMNNVMFKHQSFIDDLVIAEGDGAAGGDSDGDGMWDMWEIEHFGATNAPDGDPDNDLDVDGVNNISEYVADTDPASSNSFLAITNLTYESGGLRLYWQGGVQAKQFIDYTTNLMKTVKAWQPIVSNNPPIAPEEQWLHIDVTNNAGFYRIRAERP